MLTVGLVIAEKNFRDEEYLVPKGLLSEAGIRIRTISASLAPAVGKLGLQVEPDVLLTDVTMDMTALIFIGGGGSSQYVDDPTAHRLIWEYYDQGKIVGAICIAPIILATAGILKGRRATVFGDGIAVLKKHGAHYTGSEVEVDTRIITGRDVGAAHLFGTKLLTMMTAQ